ncbi:MAG TPA: hypothetical protein H9830_13625 [Candidatus Agrococcus pullicola]|uniref:DUF3052 domain-containing protein n=1 Tax=Candidatus Agrococcus pullicola TaxID=2838429 RepID=A0A9D1YWS4_9MICO|nr:hypothetical protein [Candidatus Agrococcus pullicola]
MNDATPLARKLQLRSDSGLWVWPEGEAPGESFAIGDDYERTDLVDADVALIFAADSQQVDDALTKHMEDLASVRAVWIIYDKGNKTDMNRDTLWIQLAKFGWKAVSQVAYSETLSALRVRPLKHGEESPV